MTLSQKGFTLIEILIATAILATMGTLAAQSIQQAVKQKKKIQEQVDITSRMRDGMRLLERDIQLAYHHRDWEKELMMAMKKKSAQTTPGGKQGFPQAQPQLGVAGLNNDPFSSTSVEAPRVDPVTHFMGSENELHFVTTNNARLSKNTIQADHIEVGYSLKNCKSVDGKSQSKCLWRRSSPWVDRNVTKDGEDVVLLEDVSEFSLRYLGKGKQDWVKEWKTNEAGDGATKGNFPTSVEISLTLQKATEKEKSDKMKKYSMQIVVPIHFPNNLAEGEADPNNPNALPPGSVPLNGGFPGGTGAPGGTNPSGAGQVPGGGR